LGSIRTSLAISNPQNLGDPVFGLLGAAAAAGGLGDTKVDLIGLLCAGSKLNTRFRTQTVSNKRLPTRLSQMQRVQTMLMA
jgi:hypothetical protein